MDIKTIEEQLVTAHELVIAKRFEEAEAMLRSLCRGNANLKLHRHPAFAAVVIADKAFADYVLDKPFKDLPSDVTAQYKKS